MKTLTVRFLRWLLMPGCLLAACLIGANAATGVSVAWAAHQTNKHYTSLQNLAREHDDLAHAYEQLLLERSAWTDYNRLNILARHKLNMVVPAADEVLVLQPRRQQKQEQKQQPQQSHPQQEKQEQE